MRATIDTCVGCKYYAKEFPLARVRINGKVSTFQTFSCEAANGEFVDNPSPSPKWCPLKNKK